MPHKHKREKGKDDASFYELAPSKAAQSLPVKKAATTTDSTRSEGKSNKRKHARLDDDTPRAFSRLLSGYRPPRSGLDDGIRPSKRHKISQPTAGSKTTAPSLSMPTPTIQPHEPLSSFNARVDASLPFSGLSKRSGGGKDAGKERKTKTEKKMQKMQKEWREEERRRKEKLKAKGDEAGVDEGGIDDLLAAAKKSKRKGGKRTKVDAENGASIINDDDDDPWANIKAKRIQGDDGKATGGSRGGLVGLHDVVLAPPRLSTRPTGKVDRNISKRPGGLKREVELTEARRSIIDGYRQMMRGKLGEEK